MNQALISEHVSDTDKAKTLVLFGGSPIRRDEVVRQLSTIPELSIYGTLSEEEGKEKVLELGKPQLVLIGGRYTAEQRQRIKSFLQTHSPETQITEPGIDIPYTATSIFNHIQNLVQK
jgi:hypothetical protein